MRLEPILEHLEFQINRTILISFTKKFVRIPRILSKTKHKKGISIVTFFRSIYNKQIRINIIKKIDDLNYGLFQQLLYIVHFSLYLQRMIHRIQSLFNKLIQERIKIFLDKWKKKQHSLKSN